MTEHPHLPDNHPLNRLAAERHRRTLIKAAIGLPLAGLVGGLFVNREIGRAAERRAEAEVAQKWEALRTMPLPAPNAGQKPALVAKERPRRALFTPK